MNCSIPSRNPELLKKLLGKKIVSVKRQLFEGDMDLFDFEQSADGPIELTINDVSKIHFFAKTEAASVGVASGGMNHYGDSYEQRDVSNNTFWAERLGQEIKQILLLKTTDSSEECPGEFGVELFFSSGVGVLIEYRDEENYPDMIRVSESYSGQPCIVWKVTQ